METETLNGVPVTAAASLIDTIRQEPANGQTTWKSVTNWKGGFQCESQIRDHTVQMDEPTQLGGTDSAPNMVETVLAAYGSCLTVGYALNASLRGITIKDLRVELEGNLDLAGFFGLSDDVPPGFRDVRAIVHLDTDASPEDVQALHEHVMKTSPVGCILSQPLQVTTELANS